ncbi:MAG: lipopolysaccharide biosynthesis protein [Acidimicrobiia bacterium]
MEEKTPPDGLDMRRRALGGLLWSFVQSWGGRAITAVLFLVLGRILGPTALGLAAYATLFIELGRVLIDQGFSQTIVQRSEIDDLDLDTTFWSSLAVGITLSAASFIAAPAIATLLSRPEMAPLLRWLSLNFVVASIGSTHLGLLQRNLQFRALAIQRLISALVGGTVGLAMAFADKGVWSLIGLQLATTATGTVILLATASWRPRLRYSWGRLAQLRGFAASVMGLQLLDYLHANGDNFIIGLVLGDTVLGYYVLAYRIYTVTLEVLGTAVATVAFPVFSRLSNDRERLRRAYLEASRLTSTFAFPVFVEISVVSPELTGLAFGPKFAPAAPMMRVLALIALTFVSGWFLRSLLLAVGRAGMQLWASLLFVAFKLGVFAAFAHHGVVPALVAQLLLGICFFPVDRLMLRAGGVRYLDHLRQFVVPLFACGVMALAVAGWRRLIVPSWSDAPRLATSALLGALVYSVVVVLLAPRTVDDVKRNLRSLRPVA